MIADDKYMTCPTCDGMGSQYGLGLHKHDLVSGSFIGSTRMEPKEKWPDNFFEDPECPGCGVWTCKTCDGNGAVEHPFRFPDETKGEVDTEAEEHHVEYVESELCPVLGDTP